MMNQYIVTGRMIEIHAGTLALEKEQAARRGNNLKRTSKSGKKYEILLPIQLKNGESFGYDGDLPKRLNHLVQLVDDIAAEKEAAEKEAAEKEAAEKEAAEKEAAEKEAAEKEAAEKEAAEKEAAEKEAEAKQ